MACKWKQHEYIKPYIMIRCRSSEASESVPRIIQKIQQSFFTKNLFYFSKAIQFAWHLFCRGINFSWSSKGKIKEIFFQKCWTLKKLWKSKMIPMTKGSRIQFFVSQMSTICQSKLRGYISSENDDIFLCFPRGYRKPRECPSFFPVRGRFPRNVRQEHLFLRWHGRIKTKWYSLGRKTKWYSFHRKIGVYSERLMFRSLNNDNKNETLFCFLSVNIHIVSIACWFCLSS